MKLKFERSGIGAGAVIAALIVVVLVAGAGYYIFSPGFIPTSTGVTSTSTTSNSSTTSNASTPSGCVSTDTVSLPQGAGSGQNFSPSCITVTAGTTITWNDVDTSAIHNVYFQSVPSGASYPSPNPSPNLAQGDSFTVTLTTPGVYKYECQYHPAWMIGEIIVTGSVTTNMTSSTSTILTTSSASTSVTTSTSTTSTTSTISTSTTTSGPTVTITLPQGAGGGLNFSPSNVTISSGTTVVFLDQDSLAPHNVWFTSVPSGATNPNVAAGQSSLYELLKGQSVSYTLTTPGIYIFECQFHTSWMQGTITVTG
jgi:plastocyanin